MRRSVLTLLNQYEGKGILLTEQVSIIKAGLKAGGESIPANLGELIYDAGMLPVMDAVCRFLHYGVNPQEV